MILNLPLLYFVWTEEYYQTSPNKNKSSNLWHITSILVCYIFVHDSWSITKYSAPTLAYIFRQNDAFWVKNTNFNKMLQCRFRTCVRNVTILEGYTPTIEQMLKDNIFQQKCRFQIFFFLQTFFDCVKKLKLWVPGKAHHKTQFA